MTSQGTSNRRANDYSTASKVSDGSQASNQRRHAAAGKHRSSEMSTTRLKEDSSTDLQQSKQERAHAKEELARAKENLDRQKYFGMIYLKARDSRGRILVQNHANQGLIESAHMPVALFLEAVKQDKFASQFIWETPPAAKNDTKADERDRAAFTAFVKQNRYGEGIANFNLAREVLGYGQVTEQALIGAVRSGRLRLAPASAQELEDREAEGLDAEKLRLLNADTRTLKHEVREGYADRQREAAQAEADRVLDEKRKWQTGQFKPLPRTWNGQLLNATFIRAASPQLIRQLREHYGSLQLDLRIRGEN